jgi:hypothetical protein
MKTSESFERYKRGYLKSLSSPNDREAVNDMIAGWDGFVAEVGRESAMKAFWQWQSTLPTASRSDCDPDGN